MEQQNDKAWEYNEEVYAAVTGLMKKMTSEEKDSVILCLVKKHPKIVIDSLKDWCEAQGSSFAKKLSGPDVKSQPPPESPSERREYREKREKYPKRGYKGEVIKKTPMYNVKDLHKPNGFVFTCNEYTMRECLEKQLFGNIPQALSDMQQFIKPNFTKIFLYNYTSRKLFGLFEAISEPAMAIDNSAWTKNEFQDSPYPAQVQVMQIQAYLPLDFTEIKAYLPRKNETPTIDPELVEDLIKLFESKGSAEEEEENTVEPPPPAT